jgi:hypothetical protein
VLLVCFLSVVVVAYVFFISAGRWTVWPTWTAMIDEQAEGLRRGHLWLAEVPSKALQALRDPLNPANMALWRWDHSYYRGHLFLYWGLVPALGLAGAKALLQIHHVVGDDVIVFAFFVGRLLVGSLLIRALARRIDPRPPPWAVGVALLVFALAHPTPYTLARGAIYEAAIVAGVCFMLAGLGLSLRGIFTATPRQADRWLAAASVCFGLAGGSRVSLLPAVVLLVAFTAFARWRIDGGGGRRLFRAGLVVCGPAAIMTFGHLLLNRLRYDAWTEFGAGYQMGNPLRVGLRFVVPNLFTYLFCPPTHTCTFPFLFGLWKTTRALSPSWLSWPVDHQTAEPTIGLFVVVLFAWLAPAGLLLALGRRLTRPNAVASQSAPGLVWRCRWLWGALILYMGASALPLFVLSATSMRYEMDFASGVLLLATLGGWKLLSAPASAAGRMTAGALYVVLALLTIVAGVLLGFSGGYFEQFKRHNPSLIHHLEQTFSVCPRP